VSAARLSGPAPCPLSDEVARYYGARAGEYDVTAGYTDSCGESRRAPIRARFQDALRGFDVLEVACGTGYWTAVIAVAARSVVAVDRDPVMAAAARQRLSAAANVRCVVADAYSLDGISGPFNAAFAHWWWSHVPRSRLRPFLTALHARLRPGAFVLLADQLPYVSQARRRDDEGNLLEKRTLRNGAVFEIVKNFPTEPDIVLGLRGMAHTVRYREFPDKGLWTANYFAR